MINIMPQTPIISVVLPKQIFDNSKKYRLFTYTVVLEYKEKILLFNTLTRELIALEKAEYENIKTDISLYKVLIEKYFYVDEDFNDKKICNQIISFVGNMPKSKDVTNYIIYPTMDCNARCFYCFEHGSKKYHMTDEIANDVADYIIKNFNGNKITIQWFGGEPLYNVNAIDIIINKLIENNVLFVSQMISNAYLLTENTVDRAKNKWNLDSVQITIDGTKEIYNKIKNYIYKPNDNAFDIVISNIMTALKQNIKVVIRLNMDLYNCEDLFELTKFLCNKFSGFEKCLSIYGSLLYDNYIKGDLDKCNKLTDSLIALQDYIFEQGFYLKNTPSKSIKNNMCCADSENSLTILPNGNIGKCEHYSDSNIIGNIYDDCFDDNIITKWKERRVKGELCQNCVLYPQCIKLKHCPSNGDYYCDISYQKLKLHELKCQIKNAYDKYIKSVT